MSDFRSIHFLRKAMVSLISFKLSFSGNQEKVRAELFSIFFKVACSLLLTTFLVQVARRTSNIHRVAGKIHLIIEDRSPRTAGKPAGNQNKILPAQGLEG